MPTMNLPTQRRAVLVGVAQIRRRPELDGPWAPALAEPARMMADAIQEAAKDAGDFGLLEDADLLATVDPLAWAYQDIVGSVATMAGMGRPVGLLAAPGGNSPCELLNEIANDIRDGESSIAVIAGAESLYSRRRARREGVDLKAEYGWPPYEGHRDPIKGQRPLTNELEARHGLYAPIQCYPLYENALRAEAGRTIDTHQRYVAELMAAHAAVAKTNPYAWFPDGWSADEIATVTPDNRWICFPYTKRMNAIIEVDQAAAVIVMSDEEADRRGVPPDHRVAFLGGASATDAWTPTERSSFTGSPAYAAAADVAFNQAGMTVHEIDAFDLYSCFPSAVEFAMKALSLEPQDPRPRTVTGGLAYAGGPGNDYSLHALAAMVDKLRAGPARVGYVSALGMTATKHAISILTTDPVRINPSSGRSVPGVEVPDAVRLGPPLVDHPPSGPATIETYTVEYDRSNNPVRSTIVLRLPDGTRTVANGAERDIPVLVSKEGVGKRGRVNAGLVDAPNQFVLEETAP
jgi:acetyl-CoA C-acetyltransferase